MQERLFLGIVTKIKYNIDGGTMGTRMVLWVKPVYGSAKNNLVAPGGRTAPFPVEINERLTIKHIKNIEVGSLLEIKSLYKIKPNKDSIVIFEINKKRLPSHEK